MVKFSARFVKKAVHERPEVANKRRSSFPIIMKVHYVLSGIVLLFLSACAQTESSSVTTASVTETVKKEEAVAEKGAKTAAHFVVGKVVGTPAKVAMAAGTVVQKLAKKEEVPPETQN